MEKNNRNGTPPVEAVNDVMDGPVGEPPAAREGQRSQTWLSSATGMDPDARRRQKRLLAGEIFMKSRLVPWLEAGTRIDEASLADLLVEFRLTQPGIETEFEISQVMGNLLNRFQYHFIEASAAGIGEISDALELDVLLFTSLTDLDFNAIDDTVRKRLISG